MSQFVIHEITTTTYQEVTATTSANVDKVILHLLRFASPAGDLTVQIQDSSGNVIATSDTIAISSLGTDTYFHGGVAFTVNWQRHAGQTYRVALVPSGGYSFSEPAYVGWRNDHNVRTVQGSHWPKEGSQAPLAIKMTALKGLGKDD